MNFHWINSGIINCLTAIVFSVSLLTPISILAGTTPDLDTLPDPTRKFGRKPTPSRVTDSPLSLQSILHSGERRSVIINGQIKTIGSWINGNQIKEIHQDSVVIARNGKLHVLRLASISNIKQPTINQRP
jgi:type II secretory pathway component PulC